MSILWSYDPKTGTYQLGNITPLEMGTLCAAVIAGFMVLNPRDTLGAEAARRNLVNYAGDLGEPESQRLLDVVLAGDRHRIQAPRN